MDGLLKRACDSCTQSKVKCSGHEPCKRCQTRGVVCVYRPKKKRGPQKKRQNAAGTGRGTKRCRTNGTQAKQDEDESFSAVTSYERRIWSVFFTIFKNQNRTREEHPWAWCWFASQLEKLRGHLERSNNASALKRLGVWLEAVDLDQQTVSKLAMRKCNIDPSRCGSCASGAIGLRHPPSNLMAAVKPLGEAAAALRVASCTCGSESGPHCGLHRRGSSSGIKELQLNDSNTGKAFMIFDSSDDYSTVKVNRLFEDRYGYDSEHMTSLLAWSGGGFLPWGGDLLAKLLVKESDLIIFLQILALKFQAIGVPDHSKPSVREIPTTHVFLLWTRNPVTGELGYVQECFMRFIHMESFDNDRVVTQMRVAFDPVDAPHPPLEEHPKVYLSPIRPGDLRMEVKRSNSMPQDDRTPLPLYSPPEEVSYDSVPAQTGGQVPSSGDDWLKLPAPASVVVDGVDESFQDELAWDLFNDEVFGTDLLEESNGEHRQESTQQQQNTFERDCEAETSEGTNTDAVEEGVDVEWLNSLLEWSNQNPNNL